ncbi:MAG: helix-hairpin-helix domain-containing protein [Bradymonadales bacterium]
MKSLRAFCFMLIFITLGSYAFAAELVVEILDVGQADGFLLSLEGKTVLIDAGEKAEQMKEYLEDRGIRRLDMVVGTHPHADHIGGMEAVLRNFDIGVYVDNGFPHTTVLYEKVMTAAEEKVNSGTMKYRVARRGQRINFGSEAYFEVLLPREIPITGTRSDINANSIILRLQHGENCILFTGDAEAETELAMLDVLGQCDVIKAAHHGSRHSSTAGFLDVVRPKVALISCGLANKHGHPGAETLERYAERNILDYRTDLSGTIKAISDGKTWRFEEEHPPLQITKININLAGEDVLRQLPGVGKKTAESIIAYREANGYFKDVNDVLLVATNSNTEKRLQKILPFIVTEGGSTTGLTSGTASSEVSGGNPYLVGVATSKAASMVIDERAFSGISPQVARLELYQVMSSYDACAGFLHINGASRLRYEKRSSVCGAMNNSMRPSYHFVAAQSGEGSSYAASSRGDTVNINTADEATLASLPGMSAAKARALISHREANGRFADCKRITDVKGIGVKTYEKLASRCAVSTAGSLPKAEFAAPKAEFAAPRVASSSANGVVNINTASVDVLKAMPGMSQIKAQKMVEDRNANGFFKSCQEATRVKGIGPKTVEKFIGQCTVQ